MGKRVLNSISSTPCSQNEHNPDACSKSGFTPLHIAAHYGNAGVARALLAAGADAGRAAKHSITPLHVASKWGQLAMVDLLVENGNALRNLFSASCPKNETHYLDSPSALSITRLYFVNRDNFSCRYDERY